MKHLDVKDNAHALFFWCYAIWIFALAAMMSLYTKEEAFLIINHFRSSFLDQVSKFATYMGNGLFVLLVVVILAILKRRKIAWTILASFCLSGIVCVLLKRIFNEPRPVSCFSDPRAVLGVVGIHLNRSHGFPSGHTTSAFSVASVIVLSVRRKRWIGLLCFFLACFVGYSRIYLGQHFVGDILVGSVLGGIGGYVCVSKSNFCLIKYGFGIEFLLRKKLAPFTCNDERKDDHEDGCCKRGLGNQRLPGVMAMVEGEASEISKGRSEAGESRAPEDENSGELCERHRDRFRSS
ncbi:MAG: phosphatase PAP2 family protein [Prevotella sp.]|jgi:membrane-associated phospholipid phosphatase|nr:MULTISPECIES: phosphatase PAP2 family protein [unclassified Prevotella]MCH3969716.1 phosphatase PAP2 family protein [Prevotella sp.]MCH3985019.1 phosphatase PAP2 family protein [Prevotella sp.]MCH3992713.1 phosphatase PAP2 family protein [Prevotella sp.]MCH4099291.1 phosphatase PAP2 family protein [Prevotella sp.]MCH4185510.1 phosphatase PAP2 family protein [Prevotella sp.]